MTPDPRFLSVVGAAKAFSGVTVLGDVELAMSRGEFISLLGPSGCGKTTLLRILAGLTAPDQGRVTLDGEDITRRPPHRRDISVVFQNYALFPHLSVAENVAFGLRARGAKAKEIAPAVGRFLDLVQMRAYADRPISALSGGQQQRVAVARALVVGPKLLLLDEPFSALDRKLREAMQIDLKRLLRDIGTTAIFVTHDQDEALTMSDRIAVMHGGRIEQFGPPLEIYRRPATSFALEFVGLSTRLPGRVLQNTGGMAEVETEVGPVHAHTSLPPGSAVLAGVRPERIVIGGAWKNDARTGDGRTNRIEAVLVDTVFQGAKVRLVFDAPEGAHILVETATLPAGAGPGARLTLSWDVEDTLIYPAAGGVS